MKNWGKKKKSSGCCWASWMEHFSLKVRCQTWNNFKVTILVPYQQRRTWSEILIDLQSFNWFREALNTCAKKLRGIKARNSGISGKWRLNVFFFLAKSRKLPAIKARNYWSQFFEQDGCEVLGITRGTMGLVERWWMFLFPSRYCLCKAKVCHSWNWSLLLLLLQAFASCHTKGMMEAKGPRSFKKAKKSCIWLKVERRVTGPQVRTNALLWKVSK